MRLGAGVVTLGPAELQLSTGETIEDTGRVLAGMLDILIARTAGDQAMLRDWAGYGGMAIINAMTADEHPTQAIADLATMYRHFGRLEGLRILYVGEGNNTAAALALGLSRCPGVSFELRTPPGYGLSAAVLDRATAGAIRSGAAISERHDMLDLPGDLHVIYTTQWQTTGTTKPTPDWRETFAPFQVRQSLWRESPRAAFMHDLPAHRGDEVTAEVLDGPAGCRRMPAPTPLEHGHRAVHLVVRLRERDAGLLMTSIAFTQNTFALAAIFCLIMYGAGVANVAGIVYTMKITPERLQGRVGSIAALLASGANAIGAIAAGIILQTLGVHSTMLLVGGAMLVTAVLAILAFGGRQAAADERAAGFER